MVTALAFMHLTISGLKKEQKLISDKLANIIFRINQAKMMVLGFEDAAYDNSNRSILSN
jgi:hypothetical protein